MSFKKLILPLKEILQQIGFEAPTDFQKQVIPKIKGGMNVIGIGSEGCGKTSAMIISVVQKLNATAFEDVPRALIFVKNKEAALELEEKFKQFTGSTDLRIQTAYEEGNINHQKDHIYVGCDIVIATPRRLGKIYFQNGINLANLQLLIVEDADFLYHNNTFHTDIYRITESLAKCQYLVFSNQKDHKIKKLQDLFMQNALVIEHK